MLYLFAIVFGFANGACGAQTSPLTAELFGLRSHGLIMGVTGLSYTIGAAVGPLLAGYLFDVLSSYQVAFLVCAAIGIIGLMSAIVLTPTKQASRTPGR